MATQQEVKKIYGMKLHDLTRTENGIYIQRVPGGWIYSDIINGYPISVFVPFNNEFQESEK